ncbi:pyridoxal phosphate-dependent aminotransferase [Desulfosporosinus sp. BICA1-9]|uniref:pyridoxal phosphate-dependent aminotransferase n=1 Tax=Desulfosporosinus sp. BICA1-9 TaxID=1531958 RepID=UPI00054BF425|nr:pyridoxal phosphate-dependent aminotransferase [Desulfosporosinus sp. BICA1-9]HBW38030.1 aminotransferase class V-fold PLP-dependent enzyme [Desulfosporosinus sp.]
MSKSLQRFLAERVRLEGVSERAKMMEIAANYKDTVNLGRGDPDLETPQYIIKAAQDALVNGATHYSPWAGILPLRKAIAKYLADFDKVAYDPAQEIMVTTGAQEAIVTTILTLVNPGDEILVPEPRYTPYDFSIALAGGRLAPVPTFAEDNWSVTVRELEKIVTPRSKILLLINPNNPTGTLMGIEELTEIADFAIKHDLIVISDELYSGLLFERVPWTSIAALPGMKERTIVINGFSKTYSMTGWRLGYLAGPAELVQPMLEVHYSLTICAPAVSQAAGLAALNDNQGAVAETVKIYEERRNLAMQRLDEIGIPYVKPMGTFYIFPQISKYGLSSFDFSVRLLDQANVMVFPGTAFGPAGEGFVRISLLRPYIEVEEGFNRMARVLGKW